MKFIKEKFYIILRKNKTGKITGIPEDWHPNEVVFNLYLKFTKKKSGRVQQTLDSNPVKHSPE